MSGRRRVVICGAGIVGVSTAYYLSRAPLGSLAALEVTVVDSLGVAQCASGKAGGFLALGWSDGDPLEPLTRAGWALHMDLMAELGSKAQEVGYRFLHTFGVTVDTRSGGHNVGVDSELARSTDASRGGPADPSVAPTSWLRHVTSQQTMGTSRDTAQVHPQKLTKYLMAIAKENGVRFRCGTVRGFRYRDPAAEVPQVAAVVVDDEDLPADVIVIAMGPWSGRASRWLPPRSSFPSAITGSVVYSITVNPETPPPPHAIFMNYIDSTGSSDVEIYARLDDVYVCTANPHLPLPKVPTDFCISESVSQRLFAIASKVSPLLATASQPDRRQACFLPLSPDGKPLIGRVAGVEGVLAATGHSCWGILSGPITGKVISEIIMAGKAESVDIALYDPARFARRGSRH